MATVPRQHITQKKIAEHVQRLGEALSADPLDSVDRTIKRPGLVARKFGHVIDYLARVELEVDRNVWSCWSCCRMRTRPTRPSMPTCGNRRRSSMG